MSLYEMLTNKRTAILEKCRLKMVATNGLPAFEGLDRGLTIMYDQLVEVIRVSVADVTVDDQQKLVDDEVAASTSRKHAQDAHQRGYTISQLVRGYGSLCQGITEFAQECKEPINSAEYVQLHLCVDIAIAQAVTEFQELALGCIEKDQRLKLGFLVHELRNCLAGAVLSNELIRMGLVGPTGSTSDLLTNALTRMRDLIDRSVAEARMGDRQELELSVFRVSDLLSEVESSLTSDSNAKFLTVHSEVDATIEIEADRHLMVSAITNLVQNAIKFTKFSGDVWIRGFRDGDDAVIEIEDRCGGLPGGKAEELFVPYVQASSDRTGLGLGLAIVRQAATLNGCTLAVRNIDRTGCVFSVRKRAYIRELQPK